MKLLLDALQGAGLSAATGLRPFLPALTGGAFAAVDLSIDFEGTEFAFLEQPWFLFALAAALLVSVLARDTLAAGPGAAALQGIGIGLGALLFAGALDDRHDMWWPGLLAGGALAAFSGSVARELLGRVRERFQRDGDAQAASALTVYAEAAGLALAAASVLAPPLALVGVGFLAVLWLRGRRRGGEKYAGLRILR